MSWFDAANTWLTEQLSTSSGPFGFVLLFVGGLLASLLPCVYPLYPITAAILARRTSKLGRFAHPLTYYAGLAIVYFAFGIIASITGGSFNDLLRLPSVNLIIGGLLLLLALATAGLLHFPVISGSGSSEGAGLGSTLLMGAGAGLLSSACVGPVVVSILVAIAAGTSAVTLGAAMTAALKMMLFGLGVGAPLLLIGVFGLALPKGGTWMVRVQYVFGALIAWFATGYVFKGLAGAGFSEAASWALLGGITLVAGAVYTAQDAESPVEERTKRAVVAVVGVLGFFVIGRAVLGEPAATAAVQQDGQASTEAAALTEAHGNLTWYLTKEGAYSAAAASGKPVFVDFHGDWCSNCKAFQERTISDQKLNQSLQGAVLLKVRDTTKLFEEYKADPRFAELKVGLPFFLITDSQGQLLYKTSDFTKSDEMRLFLPEPKP